MTVHGSVLRAQEYRSKDRQRREVNQARRLGNALVRIAGGDPRYHAPPSGQNRAERRRLEKKHEQWSTRKACWRHFLETVTRKKVKG